MSNNKSKQFLKSASVITLAIAMSKVLGFAREIVLAAKFANTADAAAYGSMAYPLVSYFVLFFSMGISSAFIPIYTKLRIKNGFEASNKYANRVLNIYIFISIAISLLAYLFAPQMSAFIWKGKDSEIMIPLITQLSRLMFPSLIFSAMSGVLCNVLNANERFLPEQLMGYCLSFAVIFAATVFGSIQAVAIATGAAAILQFLVLLPFLRGIYRYEFVIGVNDRNLQRTFIIALPALISLLFDDINSQVNRSIASMIDVASASAIGYAYKIITLVLGIVVVPLTTISFPRLSESSARGDKKGIIDSIKQSTEILALITLPIIALTWALSTELVGVMFQRGVFGPDDTQKVATVTAFYMLGVFSFGLRNFQSRVFFAMQDTIAPMAIGIVSVFIDIGLSLASYKKFGLAGITFATVIASTVSAFAMLVILRKKLGRMRIKSTIIECSKIAFAAAFCLLAASILKRFFPNQLDTTMVRLIRMAVCGLLAVVVYLAAITSLRVKSFRTLVQTIILKRRRE